MIIWLASYPRSGNTFLRIVFNSVFNIKTYEIYSIEGKHGKNSISDIIGHKFLPKDFNLKKARLSKKKYYIKTHELVDKASIDKRDKVIYLIRNGLNSSLSFEKYLQNYEKKENQFLNIIHGNTPYGSWSEHVKQWDNIDNKIIIKFEKLINNPMTVANKLSQYLNITIVNDKIPTFDELHNINPQFFRKGKKRDSRKLSKLELDLFWVNSYKEMRYFGYINNMPDIFIGINKGYIDRYKCILYENEDKSLQLNLVIKQLNIIQQQLSAEKMQLSNVYNSCEWRIGVKMQRIFKMLFPVNSVRRKTMIKITEVIKRIN